MKVKYWYINVVEKFGVILYRVTAREEYNHLFLHVLLEERKEEEETAVGGADDVALG